MFRVRKRYVDEEMERGGKGGGVKGMGIEDVGEREI